MASRESFSLKAALLWDSHLVLVLPGAPPQWYHVDSSRSWFYFTLIFPLTKDPEKAGRTQFLENKDQPSVPVGVGDVLVFDGKRKHRGSGNETRNHVRVFLYIAVYSGTDFNQRERELGSVQPMEKNISKENIKFKKI